MKRLTPLSRSGADTSYAHAVHDDVQNAATKFLQADQECLRLACANDPRSRAAYLTWCKTRSTAVRRLKQLLEDYD